MDGFCVCQPPCKRQCKRKRHQHHDIYEREDDEPFVYAVSLTAPPKYYGKPVFQQDMYLRPHLIRLFDGMRGQLWREETEKGNIHYHGFFVTTTPYKRVRATLRREWPAYSHLKDMTDIEGWLRYCRKSSSHYERNNDQPAKVFPMFPEHSDGVRACE